jgi:hypothetical protein
MTSISANVQLPAELMQGFRPAFGEHPAFGKIGLAASAAASGSQSAL